MTTVEKQESKSSKAGKEIQTAQPAHGLSPFEEMDRWFEHFYPRGWLQPFRIDWPSWGELAAPFEGRIPKVDLIDRDEALVVRAEIPGVDKEDLDISVTKHSLTIKGETRRETKEEKGDYYRSEISRGTFVRTLALPAEVDAENAKAKFKDGMLELTLPKAEKAKRRKLKID